MPIGKFALDWVDHSSESLKQASSSTGVRSCRVAELCVKQFSVASLTHNEWEIVHNWFDNIRLRSDQITSDKGVMYSGYPSGGKLRTFLCVTGVKLSPLLASMYTNLQFWFIESGHLMKYVGCLQCIWLLCQANEWLWWRTFFLRIFPVTYKLSTMALVPTCCLDMARLDLVFHVDVCMSVSALDALQCWLI